MADAPKPFVFDEKSFTEKKVKLTQLVDSESGKPNKNPHLWFVKHVQPLINRYVKGERSQELHNSFMAIKETIPPINPDIPETPEKK